MLNVGRKDKNDNKFPKSQLHLLSGEYYGSESSAVKSIIREISPTLFVKSTDLVTCKHPDLAYILHTEESIHPNRKEQHRINSINKR